MRAGLLIVVLLTGSCAAQTPAPLVCPWFSTGSAASVLGGMVTLNARVEGNFQGMCRFTRASGDREQSIEIRIGKEDTHACPDGGAKLISIGNEAVQCKSKNAQGQSLDVIAGRLRQVFFVVSTGNVPDSITIPPGPTRSSDPYGAPVLERVAEQVVGNLY